MTKIRGRHQSLGVWDTPQDVVINKYHRLMGAVAEGRDLSVINLADINVRDLFEEFIQRCIARRDAGEMRNSTLRDYVDFANFAAGALGPDRLADDLTRLDFEDLRRRIAKRWGVTRRGKCIGFVRQVFRWGFEDAELLVRPAQIPPSFRKPEKRLYRKVKHDRGPLLFTPAEIGRLLQAAPLQIKAMIMVGLNAAYTQADCSELPADRVDLEHRRIHWPRPKTEIDRVAPLWPETAMVLREVMDRRAPERASDDHRHLLFLTQNLRQPWVREVFGRRNGHASTRRVDSVGLLFGRLKRDLGISKSGHGFAVLRKQFRTIADETNDIPAIDLIMGHAGDRTMGDQYRQSIEFERLEAVVEHVRASILPEAAKASPWLRGLNPELVPAQEAEAPSGGTSA
jgi:integrase